MRSPAPAQKGARNTANRQIKTKEEGKEGKKVTLLAEAIEVPRSHRQPWVPLLSPSTSRSSIFSYKRLFKNTLPSSKIHMHSFQRTLNRVVLLLTFAMNDYLGKCNFSFMGSSWFQALLGSLITGTDSERYHQDKRIELFGKGKLGIYWLQLYTWDSKHEAKQNDLTSVYLSSGKTALLAVRNVLTRNEKKVQRKPETKIQTCTLRIVYKNTNFSSLMDQLLLWQLLWTIPI